MIYELEKLDIEKRVSIYSKCIFMAVNKGYDKNEVYKLEGIDISYDDAVNICHHVINSYGNYKEKCKYDLLYGNMNVDVDKKLVDKIYYERLRYIYELYKEYGNDNKMMKRMAALFKFSKSGVNKLNYEYIVDYLKYSPMEYEWFSYLNGKKGVEVKVNMSFSILLELLLKFEDEKDIVDIIDYSGYKIVNSSYSKIRSFIKLYHNDKSDEHKQSIYQELVKKLDLYREVKGYNKTKIILDKEKIIRDYVASDYCFATDYCKCIDLKYNSFETCVNFVKKNNNKLYNLYLIKVNMGYYDNDLYIYKMLIYWILNDVNGRKLDLLDLFSIPGFNFKKLEDVAMYSLNRKECDYVINYIKNTCLKLNKLLLSRKKYSNYNDSDIINYLNKYNIDSNLYGVVIDRLEKGIDWDDLVINMFKYVNKDRKKEKKL